MFNQTYGNSGQWFRCGVFMAKLKHVFAPVPVVLFLSTMCLLHSCVSDNLADLTHGYPDEVGAILKQQCAISGCHNSQSAVAAGGLNLETWDDLFRGSRGGSAVIPYAPDQSFLMYAVNTDSTRGPVLKPTMPVGSPPLSDLEYQTLRDWIATGARNTNGEERFPPVSSRRKWYVANQGCDKIAVFDAESKQVMRYIDAGALPYNLEQPHFMVLSPDSRYLYVVFFLFSPHMEVFSTLTDERVASISLGHNGWNSMCLTPDGKFGFVVGEQMREIVPVDLTTQAVLDAPFTVFQDIHGPAVHPTQQKLYIPISLRSGLYVLDFDQGAHLSNLRTVDLLQNQAPVEPGNLWPYDMVFRQNGATYYVACRHSNEVRCMDGSTDSLLAVVPVGSFPVDLAISEARGLLFAACMEDSTLNPGDPTRKGSVSVIDLQTHQRIRSIYTGTQPAGIAVDEENGYLVVTNRNATGLSQHHAGTCGGVNGYVTLIDLQTLEVVPQFKPELLPNPGAVVVK
jgi:YVTN family beta-propeller protein